MLCFQYTKPNEEFCEKVLSTNKYLGEEIEKNANVSEILFGIEFLVTLLDVRGQRISLWWTRIFMKTHSEV